MGIPVNDSANYEKCLERYGTFNQARVFSPLIHPDSMYKLLGYAKKGYELIKPMHAFSKNLIDQRRAILSERGWQQEKQDGDDSDEESSNM